MAMATSTGTNRKKLLLPTTMAKAGWALVEARDDVEGVSFVPTVPKAELRRLLEDIAGVALGVQPFSDPELDAAPELEVVSRIGVGYDAVDVPALTRRKIPLMIGGTANSVSVAEAGVFLTMSLARRGAAMDRLVKEGRWQDRYKEMPVDLYGKTRADHRLRQDRHPRRQALRGDGNERAGLRPVYLFRDDPRHGLRAGAGS
jgi:D-3-phosphoglycerate dehydrogenase